MSTTSTKSRNKKQDAQRGKSNTPSESSLEPADSEMSERTWRLSGLAILIVGAFLRLYKLELVPLHHDEGVNGNFLVTLVREGKYLYNPENYHGPTLYYFSAIIPWVTRFLGGKSFSEAHGLTTFNIRFVTVAFGIATIGLALMLRSRLGKIGALSAAALIAISPGTVYLSRYFIHESLYVFFTLAVIVAVLKYYDSGETVYAILAAISAGLLVATKETWIINLPVLVIALLSTVVYFMIRKNQSRKNKANERKVNDGEEQEFLARYGGPISVATVVLIAFTVFIVVNVLFYSSFFKNYPKGVNDALQTLALWRKRTHEHAHPFLQYFEWLRQEEAPLLLLGAVGAVIAVWRANSRFALFVAQWAFGLLVAYSLVRYKTPWISLNFIVPLAITSGYALNELYKRRNEPWVPLLITGGGILLIVFERFVTLVRGPDGSISHITWSLDFSQNMFAIFVVVLLAGYIGYIVYSQSNQPRHSIHFYAAAVVVLSVMSYQMYQLNFVHYDDDKYVYVYAHTRRETLVMLDQIDRVAQKLGTGKDTGIALLANEYWPLPWYFRDYPRVGYYQKVVTTTEPIIIATSAQEEELKTTIGDQYQQIDSGQLSDPRVDPQKSPNGTFNLRPGVDLLLYVRKDVAK